MAWTFPVWPGRVGSIEHERNRSLNGFHVTFHELDKPSFVCRLMCSPSIELVVDRLVDIRGYFAGAHHVALIPPVRQLQCPVEFGWPIGFEVFQQNDHSPQVVFPPIDPCLKSMDDYNNRGIQ